jgi:hypothetical protein
MPDQNIDKIARAMDGEQEPPKGHRDAVKSDKGSQLSKGIALDVLTIIRDELGKLGCRLKDYYVDFTATGFDISHIDIDIKDPQRIVDAVKEAEPEVRHEWSKRPTRYAYMAANIEIARRIKEELGLEYRAFAGQETGKVLVSVAEPKEEQPLPPSQETPDMLPPEIAQSVEEPLEMDQTDDLGIEEPIELPPSITGEPTQMPAKEDADMIPGEAEIEDMPIEGGEEPTKPEEEEPEKPMRPGIEF